MPVPLGNLVSASSVTIKIFKWWRRRRALARRVQQRREIAFALGITAAAIACAIAAMIVLARIG